MQLLFHKLQPPHLSFTQYTDAPKSWIQILALCNSATLAGTASFSILLKYHPIPPVLFSPTFFFLPNSYCPSQLCYHQVDCWVLVFLQIYAVQVPIDHFQTDPCCFHTQLYMLWYILTEPQHSKLLLLFLFSSNS